MFKKALDLSLFCVYYSGVRTTLMKEELSMKQLFQSLNFVKSDKKYTNTKKPISTYDVEKLNAGNSTSAWGIVFYR